MLNAIIVNELRHSFLSLRFHIAFLITIIVFGFGTVALLKDHQSRIRDYQKYQNELHNAAPSTIYKNLTILAVSKQDFISKPREDAFITGSKERLIPNSITYNAFNVYEFETRKGSTNPYLNPFEELNWGFIVSIILSFTVLLFAYDTISGEKETRTLAISLSNSLSRGTLLFGKYVAIIATTFLILLSGICVSLVMILISGAVALSTAMLLEILGFILVSGLLISCIAAFGLLSSVLTKNSDLSLLIVLILWVFFVVIVPNSAIFWSNTLFPIDNSDTIQKKVQSARDVIEKNAPEGRWIMISEQPFMKYHQIRAAHQMNLMNGEMQIRNAYYRDMFLQMEHARLLTLVSPISLYEYLCEDTVGGGYLRFQNVWKELHAYQEQFLTWFKAKDARDPESPHWFNPYEDISTTRKPVNPAEVPIFTEKPVSFPNRLAFGGKYLAVMALMTSLVFFAAFVLFTRYDVR